MIIPTVIEKCGNTERYFDIYSRLLKDRIIFFNGQVNEHSCGLVISQLLFLQSEDPKADIKMYINSPGGSVSDGLAIVDTMRAIKNDVQTYSVGLSASCGALILCAGTKGKRYAMPNSEVMIHDISYGVGGTATDINIAVKQALRQRAKLMKIIAESCGKKVEEVEKDCERDFYLSAEEAISYGLIDHIVGA